MLGLEILIYASVNCGFSTFAGLKIPLVIQLQERGPEVIAYDNLLG